MFQRRMSEEWEQRRQRGLGIVSTVRTFVVVNSQSVKPAIRLKGTLATKRASTAAFMTEC